MGILTWLGLQDSDDYPKLDAIGRALREALPDDESVVIRYVASVIGLLDTVAFADDNFSEPEEQALRLVLRDVDRLGPKTIDAICSALRTHEPLSPRELKVCLQQLRSLCDADERREVMRLLEQLAMSDGCLDPREREELTRIRAELGVDAMAEEADDEPPGGSNAT